MGRCPVKYYSHDMTGIPPITHLWGDTVKMLDAVLVNGFNPKQLTSITRVDVTATASCTDHGYIVDQTVLITNTDQPEYNGEQTILNVTKDTFSFKVTGSPVSPATTASTIQCKCAPMGYEIVFTGTNKRVYRSLNLASPRPYIRIDNSPQAPATVSTLPYCKITLAEGMTDIDTFTGARVPYDPIFPTINEAGGGWYKILQAGSGSNGNQGFYLYQNPLPEVRQFHIFGDDRGFYYFLNPQVPETNLSNRFSFFIGEIVSYKPGDQYAWGLISQNNQNFNAGINGYDNYFLRGLNSNCKLLVRDSSGFGDNVEFFQTYPVYWSIDASSGSSNQLFFPNPSNWALIINSVQVVDKKDDVRNLRGLMPGLYYLPQKLPGLDLMKIEDVIGYPGKSFKLITYTGNGLSRCAIDITGPWR